MTSVRLMIVTAGLAFGEAGAQVTVAVIVCPLLMSSVQRPASSVTSAITPLTADCNYLAAANPYFTRIACPSAESR